MLRVIESDPNGMRTGREWMVWADGPEKALRTILDITHNSASPIPSGSGGRSWHAGYYSYMVVNA